MTAAETFAAWALDLDAASIPGEVRRAASRHLLDGVGVAVAAARHGDAAPAVEVASRGTEPQEATIIGSARKAPAPMAALANGVLVHALDYDDTHAESLVHPTAAVLPAALAVGEETGARGADLLAACVAGYEVVIRLGAAVEHGFHARGFHPTSVCGVFASALVAAKLMGLGVRETVGALGIAGSQASGSLEFLNAGTATKPLHPGLSGMSGVLAARLAAAGADGPASIFEGSYGLFRSFLGVTVEPSRLTAGLGERWETTRITIKPYPACQLSHASLDALQSVRQKISDVNEIERITFELPRGTVDIVCEPAKSKQRPRTPYEGKFSLPYCAATLLIDGHVTIDSFEPDRLRREEILSVAARVGYREVAFAGPPADAPGVVDVGLAGGEILTGRVEESRGGPSNPLTDDELLAKFFSNCGGRFPSSEAVADALLDIESLPSVGSVLAATVWQEVS